MISVLRDRYARSWPERPEKPLRSTDRAYPMDLGHALERHFSTDSHFAAYSTPNGHRLNSRALTEGVAVEMMAIVLDVDCEATHGTAEPAPNSWRRSLRKRVVRLAEVHPDPYYYETRGGARIVYRLPTPAVLRTEDDAQRWSQAYAILTAHLQRQYGIDADPACGDWQRLYRLPKATRTVGSRPENWPIWGNFQRIGALRVEAPTADLDTARSRSRSFRQRTITNVTPCASSGDGLLYTLLRARGDVIREHSTGAYVIRCPRESEHSTGRTGDGSTLLYLPAAGKQVGAIHCMHGHCSAHTQREWVACFSESELDRANGVSAA